jgi:TonB-dependent receptor
VVGNPNLKPAYSYNLDFIYEYYWGNKGMFSIGTYGKYIIDHIFMTVSSDTTQSFATDATAGFVTKSFKNAGNSWVWGVEADFKRKFDFLPRFLSGFGLSANITYSISRMYVPGRSKGQQMAEQTPLLYNVSLFYEKYGVNARIAMNYTGASLLELNLVSKPGGNGELLHKDKSFDTFLGEIYSLDFQLSYDFLKHFSVYIEANNLLDSPYKEYRGDPNRPIRIEYYKPRGQIGFKYEL